MNDLFFIPVYNSEQWCIIDVDSIDHFKQYEVNLYSVSKSRSGSLMVYPRNNEGKKKCVSIGRFILNYTGHLEVDHKNRLKWDNRKSNLRLATRSQNAVNILTKGNSYRGVSKITSVFRNKPYMVKIRTRRGRVLTLGYCATPEEAARLYDQKAKEIHGEFAILNFPEEVKG